MKLLSTYTSADKKRKSDVSIVDEQTYAVEYYSKEKLTSYAYYNTYADADLAAEKYVLEVDSQ